MAFAACVADILCALSAPVRGALAGLIQGSSAILQAQVALLSTQLAVLDIALVPLQAAAAVAQGVLDAIESSVNLLPLSLLADCGDLGKLNVSLSLSIDVARTDLETVVAKVSRHLSLRDELQASIDELNATLNLFTDYLQTLRLCA